MAGQKGGERLPVLTLGALGVVFGDIGTSPLYALKQCFKDAPELTGDPTAIVGTLSLILWSLILVVCIKYVGFVMRADHEGEGGTFALLALIQQRRGAKGKLDNLRLGVIVVLALIGAGLLYGDGAVTPAISVLSAVEGLDVATDALKAWVVPISAGILLGLFLLQPRGTGRVGTVFGPVMAAWFIAIGALGVVGIARHPAVLSAFDPRMAAGFLVSHGWAGALVLGAVVLCFSGTEALFADLGHFGRRPIVLAWYGLVLPALMLNYLGQGALLSVDKGAASAPFFALVPLWALYPMVVLSTAATVIASQALISGAFSLTQQAVHMGYCPRLLIRHTSQDQAGQIYMPVVNVLLMVATLALVLGFRSSDALGNAYGLAVIGTMTVTSWLYLLVMRRVWHWPLVGAVALLIGFQAIDLPFLAVNLTKIASGAWVPLLIGAVVFTLMAIWSDGLWRYGMALRDWAMPVDRFMAERKRREHGTAVLMTRDPERVPLIGRHDWLRDEVQAEHLLLMTIEEAPVPNVGDDCQLQVETTAPGMHRLHAAFGFMQPIDVQAVLRQAQQQGLALDWDHLVFYLPLPLETERGGFLRRLRRRIFLFLRRAAMSPVEYFHIAPRQVVLVGLELET